MGVASAGWSPWAQGGAVTVYAKPELGMEAHQGADDGPRVDSGDPLESLPLVLVLTAGAGTSQVPVSWAVEVIPTTGFRYVGEDGEDAWMAGGSPMLSSYIDANDADFSAARQLVPVGAADGAFVDGVPVLVRAMAVMDSGLQTDWAECTVTPHWDATLRDPDATAEVMPDYTAAIWPSCEDPRELAEGCAWMLEGSRLTLAGPDGGADDVTVFYLDEDGETLSIDIGEAVFPAVAEMSEAEGFASLDHAEISVSGTVTTVDLTPESGEHHEVYDGLRYADAVLSVYRIDPDGAATLVADGLENNGQTVVVDPYPNFGTCRYRVCANSAQTDEVTYSDVTLDLPFEFLLIQWGASSQAVEDADEAEGVVSYSCESVEIRADIAPVERGRKDKTLNEYIGREHPVVDYGTQLGITGDTGGAFNVQVDQDVIPQLRKLRRAMEPAYVRWPAHIGGLGFWADVDVEIGYPAKGAKATVRLSITRVEEASR